jgi:hypothetical protein
MNLQKRIKQLYAKRDKAHEELLSVDIELDKLIKALLKIKVGL